MKKEPLITIQILNWNRAEETLRAIQSALEQVISTYLLGLIVSHAYGVKSVWYNYVDKLLYGDSVKFYDYFSSVSIPEHEPILFDFDIFDDITQIIEKTQNSKGTNSFSIDLNFLQQKLLNAAPFEIDPIYFK